MGRRGGVVEESKKKKEYSRCVYMYISGSIFPIRIGKSGVQAIYSLYTQVCIIRLVTQGKGCGISAPYPAFAYGWAWMLLVDC